MGNAPRPSRLSVALGRRGYLDVHLRQPPMQFTVLGPLFTALDEDSHEHVLIPAANFMLAGFGDDTELEPDEELPPICPDCWSYNVDTYEDPHGPTLKYRCRDCEHEW